MAKPHKPSIVRREHQNELLEILLDIRENNQSKWNAMRKKIGPKLYGYRKKLKEGEMTYDVFIPLCINAGLECELNVFKNGEKII